MANPWFRLWTDMVNDPKWRTIARVSKQEISRVLSVYLHMMTCASNATERGRTQGWCDEDIATALDIETSDVQSIREAMQGRVLDGDYLTGWEKRQPLREDGAADRAKAYRERQKELKQTQENATERNQSLDKIREEEIRREESKPKTLVQRASRLPADWTPSVEDIKFCQTERPDLEVSLTANEFRDYWLSAPKGSKLDWSATWRNWVRKQNVPQRARGSPQGYESAKDRSRREAAAKLTGSRNEPTFIDITPSPAELG